MTARLSLHVQPRASRTGLAGRHGDAWKLRVAAPPVDDAANEAVIAYLAESLGLARRQVRIVSGAHARRKIVEIEGLELAAIEAWLARQAGSAG